MHYNMSTRSSRLEVTTANPDRLKAKPEVKDLVFGKTFTDHMLRATWSADGGWGPPRITPFDNFSIHPAAKALHYAQVCGNIPSFIPLLLRSGIECGA